MEVALPPLDRRTAAMLGEGASFGPFRIVRQLGRGGYAPVLLAEEIHDGKKLRDVALKLFFLPEQIGPSSVEAIDWRDRILEEARALCRVEHPSVVRFYSVHREDARGTLGLAMEHVAGASLATRLHGAGSLDERTVLDVGIDVAWALSAVHAAGLVHRDVKPANIVCGVSGYKLIDFGIVAEVETGNSDPSGELAMRLAAEGVELSMFAGPAVEFAARVLRVELNYASSQRDLALAKRDLDRALAIAQAASSAWQEVHIAGDLAVIEAELGRTDAAIERLRRLIEQTEARGMRGERRRLSQNLAAFLLRDGRAREAAEVAAETARLAMDAGDPSLGANALSLCADALRRLGELDAALASINEAEVTLRLLGDRMRPLTLLRRAEILEALGRADEGAADAQTARLLAKEHGDRSIEVAAVLWEMLYLARRGDVTAAELARAIADAAAPDIAGRALTRSLIARAEEWVRAAGATLPR